MVKDDDDKNASGAKWRKVSAPGKLVLAGEYAVLEGHAAWVTAVNRRAEVDFQLSASASEIKYKDVFVTSQSCARQKLSDTRDCGYFDLVRACVELVEQEVGCRFSGELRLDTSAMESGEKLGIGSSAAIAVALCVALLFVAANEEMPLREKVHALAHTAHLLFSGGKGSGIDVAAGVYGGSLCFIRGKGGVPQVKAAPLKIEGLEVLVVYTGISQSTREFVARVQMLKGTDFYHDVMMQLAHAAENAMAARSVTALLDAMGRAKVGMQALGDASGADIMSAPHRQIAEIAESFSGVAKPSGAGGGDVALAFFRGGDVVLARESFKAQGFAVVSLGLGAAGVRLDAG